MDRIENDSVCENKKSRIDTWMSDIMRQVDPGKSDLFIREGEKSGNLYYNEVEEKIDDAYGRLEKELAEKLGECGAEDIILLIEEYTDAVREMHFSIGLEIGVSLYEKVKGGIKSLRERNAYI